MALSPLSEFILAQTDGPRRIAHPDLDYLSIALPGNMAVAIDSFPVEGRYMLYAFRFLVDLSVVPGAFRFQVFQGGARPWAGTILASPTLMHMDYFYRVFWGGPVRLEITNLTPIFQTFSGYSQFIDVDNEADYQEIERRIKLFYRYEPAPQES